MNFSRELLLRVLIPFLAASVTCLAGRGIRDACVAVTPQACTASPRASALPVFRDDEKANYRSNFRSR